MRQIDVYATQGMVEGVVVGCGFVFWQLRSVWRGPEVVVGPWVGTAIFGCLGVRMFYVRGEAGKRGGK